MAFTNKLGEGGFENLPESFEEIDEQKSSNNIETESNINSKEEGKEVIIEDKKEDVTTTLSANIFDKLPDEFEESETNPDGSKKENKDFYPTLATILSDNIEILDFTEEELNSLTKDNFETSLASKINSYLKEQKELIQQNVFNNVKQFVSDKDVNIDDNDFGKDSESKIQEDSSYAENIVKHYYNSVKGLDSNTIDIIINNEVDIESLALKLNTELHQINLDKKETLKQEFEATEQARKSQMEQEYNTIKESISSLDKTFPTLNITNKITSNVLSNAEQYWKDINLDFTNYGPKIALFKELGFFDGNFDVILNTAKKSSLDKMKNMLNDR